MGTMWLTVCGILIFIVQASHVACYTCAPGFDSDMITFKVPGEQLRKGMRLGKVNFTDCTDRTTFLFSTDDDHFMVQIDGTLVVKRQVLLHEGHRDFFIHSWDSQGHKLTVPVMVLHQDEHHLGNQIPQNHRTEVDSETAADQHVSILHFPKSDEGLRRRKREWILPPISIIENMRGQFPQKITQVRSDEAKKIHYRISGPGADQPPVGLFIMDKDSGILYITQALDRESQATYTLLAHAVEEGSSATLENVLEVRINVVDQNDNKPVFTNDTFAGDVAENSPKGFEVIKVEATDADDPDTDNADIRYRIVSQEPQEPSASMFVIDPVTGGIRVDADGLDREKYPQYTLVVEAADMGGVGLTGNTTVILSVTQSKDNAPDFIVPATADDQHVPVINFPKSDEGLRRRKRGWVIPDISVLENARGKFPQKITQIRSDGDREKKIFYGITGPGADLPPVKLFTVDRDTGVLYVTQPVDRERQAVYVLKAHAVAEGAAESEQPMDIIVKVIDQNDNHPVFSQSTYLGEVAEASPLGYEVIQVEATDLDEPDNENSIIRYSIVSQDPKEPSDKMFVINEVTGMIRVNSGGLDRETIPQYTLVVRATDGEGKYLSTEAKVILKVTDSNDNAPIFTQSSYEASVPENKVDAVVIKMEVTDKDDPNSPAWNSKFKIILGDPGNLFTVETGPNKQEGILKTVKGLDFERSSKHILVVTVENEVPFAVPLPTSTATVVVTVLDVNEPPIFNPQEKQVSQPEDLKVESHVTDYTASDPDTARKQKVMYRMISDPAGWLNVDPENGRITVKSEMDRESPFVKDNRYMVLIGAYDNDELPATGTGTLFIQLEDVNDHAPSIVERDFRICNKKPAPQTLTVVDKDGPGFSAPYRVSIPSRGKSNWTATMDSNKTAIMLGLAVELEPGVYTVVLKVADVGGLGQDSTIQATVCDCTGEDVECQDKRAAAVSGLPFILGILGGILLLLILALLLILFTRRRRTEKKELLLEDDDIRDDIYYYDEEGGGEDDQDFDLSVLHRGLDNRPEVFRNDVIPNFMPAPQYRPRPANPDEIGNFIDDNLKAADNDPTAPPYDSLLVFDYEGGGSDAGSLSSLNSASSGDQDYNCLNEWGPRFKKLADMYGGGEDDML